MTSETAWLRAWEGKERDERRSQQAQLLAAGKQLGIAGSFISATINLRVSPWLRAKNAKPTCHILGALFLAEDLSFHVTLLEVSIMESILPLYFMDLTSRGLGQGV